MRFQAFTEEEIQTAMLAPDGIYEYFVSYAKEGISKYSGKEKIDLTLKIISKEGQEYTVFTNLSLPKLLKHFCDVNGMQEQYKQQLLTDDMCMNKSGGCVMIGIAPEKENPNGGMYPAKNIVKDYVFAPHGSTLSPMKPLPAVKDEFSEDQIPF